MPGLKGPEVFAQLVPAHPEMRALFISGYPGTFLDNGAAFLRKPFRPAALLDKLREILCE